MNEEMKPETIDSMIRATSTYMLAEDLKLIVYGKAKERNLDPSIALSATATLMGMVLVDLVREDKFEQGRAEIMDLIKKTSDAIHEIRVAKRRPQ